MRKAEKKEEVKKIKKRLEKSDGVLLLCYRGIKVYESNELRRMLKTLGAELRVVKNSLARIALEGTDKEKVSSLIEGPVALVLTGDDPSSVAKALKQFSQGRKEFRLLGGLYSGRLFDEKEAEWLASLPPRDILIAKMLGSVSSPVGSLVSIGERVISKLIYTLSAVARKRELEENQGGA
ncbi:MAG: 50S ribosomal protein L10 [Actinomycetota bacterium]|nr:50S ribosomal protein L10 [Actinomycetota bacterium]